MGGKWTMGTVQCGLGYFEHFMNARRLIWPERYRHRWTDLLYENFVKNDVTIMMGAASTGKTATASEFVLINYWARPDKTLVVLSTVTREKLDTGVFGEVKMLWEAGRKRWPNMLAGNLLEHKQQILTDNLKETQMRDARKGIVGKACFSSGGSWIGLGTLAGTKQEYLFYLCDECFPAGTMVDTPTGPVAIETIRPGDTVISAAGPRRTSATRSTISNGLVCVRATDGREIVCTPNHPFFTQKGWIKAGDLNGEHYMLSPDETLRILQTGICPQNANSTFLLSELSAKMDASVTRKKSETVSVQTEMVGQRQGRGNAHQDCCSHDQRQSNARPGDLSQGDCCNSGIGNLSESEGRKRDRSDESGMATHAHVSRGRLELLRSHWQVARQWLSNCLQSGSRISTDQAGYRSRWSDAQFPSSTGTGSKEGCFSKGSWVDRVTVLKQNHSRFQTTGNDPVRCRVYNLQIEGHHSYSVNGFAVANCQFMAESFIGSWPNIFSNGNVKIIGSGNPKHDPDDQLGIAAEPKEGWTARPVPTKTDVWETQFLGGCCINLVGTDSPNLDFPEGLEPYPKLIGRKFINRIKHDWGENSPEFYSQCKGVMRIDMADQRIITRLLCREHHAQEKAVWSGKVRTKVLGLDPSYGGGDQCIGTFLSFGEDEHGKEIISIDEQKEYRVDMSINVSVEDQIATMVKEDLKDRGMPANHAFYDPYGKGTMGFAFARAFGADSPIPVDSGGQPTERPVREGLYVEETDGKRRPKTCYEHYAKFVTEAWFSVRYAIEAEQLRGLETDCMLEGCARKYEMVAGNKISAESKDEYKARAKHSPNKFDSLAVGVEGARQRGFSIAKLGEGIEGTSSDDFFETEAKEWQELISGGLLNHTGQKRELSLDL